MVTRLLIRAIVTVIVLAIAAGLSMAMRAYLRRRAKALDAGCVACGSHELETRGAVDGVITELARLMVAQKNNCHL